VLFFECTPFPEYLFSYNKVKLTSSISLMCTQKHAMHILAYWCWIALWLMSIIKPTRYSNFSNLLWNRTLHVSDSFSFHRRESSTVHTATGICHTGYADCLLASSQHNLYDIQGATQKSLDKCYKTQITSYIHMIYFYSSKYIPP
jgi:hypothetical protein